MPAPPFPDRPCADALDKVKGTAANTADVRFPGLLYAMTVPSPVAKGRVAVFKTDAALRVPGLLRILTPAEFPPAPRAADMPGSPRPGLLAQVAFSGEPIAIVVAETLEAAIEGAEPVRSRIEVEPFGVVMDSPASLAIRLPTSWSATPSARFPGQLWS
jgi:xanthine dehydrogenase YagR molybdenum-binding subunit